MLLIEQLNLNQFFNGVHWVLVHSSRR